MVKNNPITVNKTNIIEMIFDPEVILRSGNAKHFVRFLSGFSVLLHLIQVLLRTILSF